MKEIKVYVDELPKSCWDCFCQDNENGRCKILEKYTDYVPKDCPLIDIKTHDRELVKEVCEKIRNFLLDKCEFDYGYYINDGDFTVPDLWYFLDQIDNQINDLKNKN